MTSASLYLSTERKSDFPFFEDIRLFFFFSNPPPLLQKRKGLFSSNPLEPLKDGPLQAACRQEEVRQEDQPEQARAVLDPPPHRQPHQVEREAPPLAPHEAALLNSEEREREKRSRGTGSLGARRTDIAFNARFLFFSFVFSFPGECSGWTFENRRRRWHQLRVEGDQISMDAKPF